MKEVHPVEGIMGTNRRKSKVARITQTTAMRRAKTEKRIYVSLDESDLSHQGYVEREEKVTIFIFVNDGDVAADLGK